MKRLSHAQMDILVRMNEYGEALMLQFPYSFNRNPKWLIGPKETMVSVKTVDSLKDRGLIEFSHMTRNGMTKHYWRLTEKGKAIKG